ncbi:MAG: sigma-54 dependent transcriptional regulator [candidate division Zixibacteria bacterium]
MILIIDDEKYIRSSLSGMLADEGYDTVTAESAEKGEQILFSQDIDLILLDIQMPGKDGITFLDDNRNRIKDIPVIIISGKSDIPTAVVAIKLGSFDFIEKPLMPERVLVTVKQALRLRKSFKTEEKLSQKILDKYEIFGQSEPIRKTRQLIEKVAGSDATILITGENGVGKELVAYNIHYKSSRRGEPLVVVNCPAIPENLFESELFGHVRGAFTGAQKDRVGRFEKAGGGTLFLDEIGDLTTTAQTKLLRVLESGQFEKVGSDVTQTSNCRIMAATNQNLKKRIESSSFREDLYYRLNVISIEVPSLRDRVEDIPHLINHFLQLDSSEKQYAFSADALGYLAAQSWPGNIRQLKNFTQQIMFTCEPDEITVGIIEEMLQRGKSEFHFDSAKNDNKLTNAVRQFERGFLSDLYQKHDGNIAAMARYLNMDRGNLSRKLKSLNIM